MYEIIFYEKENGEKPAYDFFYSLSTKMQSKLLFKMQLLEIQGPALREPHTKYLGDKILELRAEVEGDIPRILFFFVVGQKVVLTNGFIKKTQKTPQSELNKAKEYMSDYFRREMKNDGNNI